MTDIDIPRLKRHLYTTAYIVPQSYKSAKLCKDIALFVCYYPNLRAAFRLGQLASFSNLKSSKYCSSYFRLDRVGGLVYYNTENNWDS